MAARAEDLDLRLGQPSLRALSATATLLVALTAIAASFSFIVLASRMRGASQRIRESMATVRQTEEATLDLLAYSQTTDPVARSQLETTLRERLTAARPALANQAQQAAFKAAAENVNRFVSATDAGATAAQTTRLLATADAALSRLVQVNVSSANTARDLVARWDETSNVAGIVASLLMIAVLAFWWWWIRRFVIRPVIAVSASMERFGKGELETRATEGGAAEIRRMAARFNMMASALTRERHARLSYLAGVAHDLKNPLSALQLAVAGLKPEHTIPSAARMRQVILMVQRQVSRLNRMVNDLLEGARIEAGHIALELVETDLRWVIEETVSLYEGTSPIHAIAAELPDEPVEVSCDPLRMEQVLSNLISNAIKYSPHGGEVRVSVRRESTRAVISVADHGRGMTPEELDGLWEPFQRTGPATGAIPGIGLGLWNVRRIIEAHQGEVSVESTPDVGSVFSITLPLFTGQARTPPTLETGHQRPSS